MSITIYLIEFADACKHGLHEILSSCSMNIGNFDDDDDDDDDNDDDGT